MVSDVPVAAMCSGGVDSSLVTACAKGYKPDIVGYVANVEGVNVEAERSWKVHRDLGIHLRRIDIDRAKYIRQWPSAVWHGEFPTIFANDVPFLILAQEIKRDGVTVVLTGEGADELFGGYYWQADSRRKWSVLQKLAPLLQNRVVSGILAFVSNKIPPASLEFNKRRPFWRVSATPAFSAGFLAAVDGGRRICCQQALFDKLEPIRSLGDRAFLARCLDDMYGHLHHLLLRNDRLAMSASLETRVPFIENRLIDMAMHMPLYAKLGSAGGKQVIKQVAEKRLCSDIVHAKKIGFDVPPEIWRSTSGLLHGGAVADLFGWSAKNEHAILTEVLENPDILLAMLGLEIWTRIFLRSESPDSVAERIAGLPVPGKI